MTRITFARVLSLVPIFAATLSTARPTYPGLVPNGQNPALPCMELGHIDCDNSGGPRNQFGLDFAANDRTWDETLCMMDSDGDGLTNGEELGDPCCTWRSGDDDSGLRMDNLSNPGDETSTDAEGQEGCPDGGVPLAAPADGSPAPAPDAAPAASAEPAPLMEDAEPVATMADMGPPKLMTASPVPTGVYEQMDGDNPLMTASPVPTGVYPAADMMAPSAEVVAATGAPAPVGAGFGAPAGSVDPVLAPAAETVDPVFQDADPLASATPAIIADGVEATPTANPVGDLLDAAACFPGEATATLKDGSVVSMKNLKVGDEVLAKFPDVYSAVYMFSHKEQESVNDFVRIATSNGLYITASPGHYIVVDGKLKAAAVVVAGDKVVTKEGDAEVVGVEAVKMSGLYNPHTLAGSVVVDGVLASDVTTAVKPSVARTLLAPFKFMYSVFQRDVSAGFLNNGWALLAQLAPAGAAKEL